MIAARLAAAAILVASAAAQTTQPASQPALLLDSRPAPIVLRSVLQVNSTTHLSACDFRNETGDPYPIRIGKPGTFTYDIRLTDIRIQGGGVFVQGAFGQTVALEGFFISDAPEDGLRIVGTGERVKCEDIHIWKAKRDGIVISTVSASNNGMELEHCSAAHCGGVGLLLETATMDADQIWTLVRGCVFQANHGAADVLVRGYVNATFRDSHFEAVFAPVAFRAEPAAFGSVKRTPAIAFEGMMQLAYGSPQAYIDGREVRIEQCGLTPKVGGTAEIQSRTPIDGAKRRIPAGAIKPIAG